jgi:hypothetical protein
MPDSDSTNPFREGAYVGVDGWGGEAGRVGEMEEAGGRGCTEEVTPATAAASKERYKGSSAAGSGVRMGAAAGTGDRRERDEAPHAGDIGKRDEDRVVRKPTSKAQIRSTLSPRRITGIFPQTY